MIPLVEEQAVGISNLMSRKFNGGINRRMDSMVDDRPRVLICSLLSLLIRRSCSYSLPVRDWCVVTISYTYVLPCVKFMVFRLDLQSVSWD